MNFRPDFWLSSFLNCYGIFVRASNTNVGYSRSEENNLDDDKRNNFLSFDDHVGRILHWLFSKGIDIRGLISMILTGRMTLPITPGFSKKVF